jgi:hypothetical protein
LCRLPLIAKKYLAQQMTQEFVDAYALTLNGYLDELIRVARARQTQE